MARPIRATPRTEQREGRIGRPGSQRAGHGEAHVLPSPPTALERAADDHLASFRLLRGVADLVVVNVSSPNTPGLRELQDRDHLTAILGALRDEDASMRRHDGPGGGSCQSPQNA